MSWPVSIPSTVATPAKSASAAATRFDLMLSRSMPLDQKEAALALARQARADLLKAMKALAKECREAKSARDGAARAAARYARDEERLTSARAAQQTGERMAASMAQAVSA